jgi:5-formyltetrahydrofolate cyclo-ligase
LSTTNIKNPQEQTIAVYQKLQKEAFMWAVALHTKQLAKGFMPRPKLLFGIRISDWTTN